MNSAHRPSSVIRRQIADFEAIIPKGMTSPPEGDFAAELQWDAWQGHLQELKAELEAALDHELEGSNLQICLDGDPVEGHAIKTSFFADLLRKATDLVNSMAQSILSPEALDDGDLGLLFQGSFASSFGLKLSVPECQVLTDANSTSELAERFCHLFDSSVKEAELVELMSTAKIRQSYTVLMKLLAENRTRILVRTPAFRDGFRLSPTEAKDRQRWLSDYKEQSVLLTLSGKLTGGDVSRRRFRFTTADEVLEGKVSEVAQKHMESSNFGAVGVAKITKITRSKRKGEPLILYRLEEFEVDGE